MGLRPIFLKPLIDKPSYCDLYKMAELSGFETRTVDSIERRDGEVYINIFFTNSTLVGVRARRSFGFLKDRLRAADGTVLSRFYRASSRQGISTKSGCLTWRYATC